MLRYDIDPSTLDANNRDLIGANQEILQKLVELVNSYIDKLESGGAATKRDDGLLQRFQVLMAMAMQYGLEAGDIADRLGVTVSTVHRWAKGTFVPPQVFVRAAAMRGILALLMQELESLRASGYDSCAPERYLPQLGGSFFRTDTDRKQETADSVVAFEKTPS